MINDWLTLLILKICETLALEWCQIDFEKRTFIVNKTLTKAEERDYNGAVMGKIKKTFSDITKIKYGNMVRIVKSDK